MMNTQLSETLLKYSDDRSRFGKGPKKPNGIGHCSNETCGDAIGVRVWWQTKPEAKIATITNVWWTGQGCVECMAMAAYLAERMVGETVNFEILFDGLSPGDNTCAMTAIRAFDRAIWGQDEMRFDRMDLDINGEAWEAIEEYKL